MMLVEVLYNPERADRKTAKGNRNAKGRKDERRKRQLIRVKLKDEKSSEEGRKLIQQANEHRTS
ncbi:MAG: hypothetical protein LC127_02470 [Chitinophagales bacterium]|nr:hypothetical protein [Chitinophagales bacterium]